jgi:hypothetical protein
LGFVLVFFTDFSVASFSLQDFPWHFTESAQISRMASTGFFIWNKSLCEPLVQWLACQAQDHDVGIRILVLLESFCFITRHAVD